MRALEKLAVWVGFAAGAVAIVAAAVGWELGNVTSVTSAEPTRKTVADLAVNGVGDNSHLELTDFKFGKPVIEEADGRWRYIWIPLEPPPAPKPKDSPGPKTQTKGKTKDQPREPDKEPTMRAVFLRTTLPENQAELDAFVQQKTVRVLATGRFSKVSLFWIKPSNALWTAKPDLDDTRTVFLTDPYMAAGSHVVMPAEVLFDRTPGYIAIAVAAVGFSLAFFSLFLGRIPEPRRPLPPKYAADRAALLNASPRSIHFFLAGKFLMRLFPLYAMAAPVVLLLAIGAAYAGFSTLLRHGLVQQGIIGGVAGALIMLGLFWGAWYMVASTIKAYRLAPSIVVVCDRGLRWKRGGKVDVAVWEDVASVRRGETIVMQNGVQVDHVGEFLVTLKDGRELRFEPDKLSDYDKLADAVQGVAQQVVADDKQKESATGTVTFGPVTVRTDGVVLDGKFQPWSNIERTEIENGYLRIYLRSSWFFRTADVALANIPDYLALMPYLQARGSAFVPVSSRFVPSRSGGRRP